MPARDQGKTFLQGVIAKLPAEKQAQYAGLVDDPDAGVILDEIGQGVLRQADYSRKMNEVDEEAKRLAKWHQDLTTWHTGKVEEFATKEAELAAAKPAAPAGGEPPVKNAVTREELDQFSRAASYSVAQLNELSMRHLRMFDEVLPMTELLQRKEVIEHGLDAGYKLIYKEKLDAHTAAITKKREDDLRAEGRKQALDELGSTRPLPYLTRPGDVESPLDALAPKDSEGRPRGSVVDEAVDEYHRLVNASS